MTNTELEELGVLLEDLRLWLNAAPLHLCPTRDALIRGDMDKFYSRVESQCEAEPLRSYHIRKLEAENAELKRDRAPVTPEALSWGKEEAARIERKEKALEALESGVRTLFQWDGGELAEGYDARKYIDARDAITAALAALEEQSDA